MIKGIKKKFLRFKQIFKDAWYDFIQDHPRYNNDYYKNEVNKMLNCSCSEGGFAKYKCTTCGQCEHTVHMSCKGKACPQCGKRYARDSMVKIASKLFKGINYRQIVLTIPQEFRPLFYNHKDQASLYSAFMQGGYACLKSVVNKMYYSENYEIAAIVFIHTHSRNGEYKPHLHILLGEGGLHLRHESWRPFQYIPMNLLRLKWKEHLLRMMREKFPNKLVLIDEIDALRVNGLYAHPGKASDVPTKSYSGLIKYLTKYLAAPPIGLSKILDYNGDKVKYYYKSHSTKRNECEEISVKNFIGRMLQHILPKNFQRLRYYGLQRTAVFKKYYILIADLLGDMVDKIISYAERITYAKFFEEVAGRNPLNCTHCGNKMELWQIWHPIKGMVYDLHDRLLNGKGC